MTAREKRIYKFDLFQQISIDGFDYEVHPRVITIINRIAGKVGAPTYIKTPIFQKRNYDYNKKRNTRKSSQQTEEEWELLRTFETGKVVKNDEGINKTINNIYGFLNKITIDTYEQMHEDIVEKITDIIDEASRDDLLKVGTHIFEIGAANRFYSNLYAKLFKALVNRFSSFKSIFVENYKNFIQIFDNIEVVSCKDYEKFCRVNKKNDERRSMVAFVVNLMKYEMVSIKEILSFVQHFIHMFRENMKQEDNKPICEEISEILYIMITLGIDDFIKQEVFQDTWRVLVELSEMTALSQPSLSNKSIFKLMDMVDELEDKFD